MKHRDFRKQVKASCLYETIYNDSEGREILVIRLLDAYVMVRDAVQKEREECAKVCEENGKEPDDHKAHEGYEEGYQDGSNNCAAAIRARNNT